MSERDFMAKFMAERASREARRAEDWPKALDKLHITFEAEHGGGYPQCLAEWDSEEERLRYLKELGFRVRRHFSYVQTGDTREEHWVELYGGIVCGLDDGWVCKSATQ